MEQETISTTGESIGIPRLFFVSSFSVSGFLNFDMSMPLLMSVVLSRLKILYFIPSSIFEDETRIK